MKVVHLELSEANNFVELHHRHHKPVQGHRFSIGCIYQGRLVGVAIVGRPVARHTNQQTTVEVVRLCTDGTYNACSFLYAKCAHAAKALGYKRIQTFILESELGTSLKASGWQLDHITSGGSWSRSSRHRLDKHPTQPKQRWSKELHG